MKRISFPQAFQFLREPHKIKVAYGGRGGAKSWCIAQYILLKASSGKHRVLCARELQNSIKESVHQLFKDQIELLELGSIFQTTDQEIFCTLTKSEIRFKGLKHNSKEIKSMEGITITWVEEATNVSEQSWTELLPTIFRTKDAELIVSFNTGYEDDSTYQRFVKNPPEGCVTKLINFDSNPYFPKELDEIRKDDLRTRPLEYGNIWLGQPKGYGGKVWPQFIDNLYPNGHLRKFDWRYLEQTANILMACDPAQKYYPACLWAAVFPCNKRMRWPEDFYIWVFAEYPDWETFGDYFYKHRKSTLCNLSLKEQATIFLGKDNCGHRVKCNQRFIDSRFALGTGGGNTWSNETHGIVQAWSKPENGSINFDLPNIKYIDSAKYDIVKDFHCNWDIAVNSLNCPRLYIAPDLKNLRYALANHRVEENSEKESEKLKDMSDALKILYAGLFEYSYKIPKKGIQNTGDKEQHLRDKTITPNDSWMY